MQPSSMVLSLSVPLYLKMPLNQCQQESVCTRMGSVYGQVRQTHVYNNMLNCSLTVHIIMKILLSCENEILLSCVQYLYVCHKFSLSSYTECTAWLSPCQTSWECGSNYEYRVSQAQPLPPCPNPGEYFVSPPMPGLCEYVLESGQCQFHGERKPCSDMS